MLPALTGVPLQGYSCLPQGGHTHTNKINWVFVAVVGFEMPVQSQGKAQATRHPAGITSKLSSPVVPELAPASFSALSAVGRASVPLV